MSEISSLTHAISVDPYSGEQIGAYPYDTDAALDAALQRAKAGYAQWRQVSLGQRSEYLLALANTLDAKAEAFAQMDDAGDLQKAFAPPKSADEELVAQVENEEGWILGV